MRLTILALFFSAVTYGQINQNSIARQIGWGPNLPATCSPSVGQVFFKVTAGPAGTPYYCSAPNTWTLWGAGNPGAGYGPATSTTSLTIGTGAKTLSVQSGLAYTAGAQVLISYTTAPASDNMYGTVTSYSGTTLVVNITTVTGSGTFATWTVNVAGVPGPTGATGMTGPTGMTGMTGPTGMTGSTGATGPGYIATSATSLAIATGSTSFTTQSGLAYVAGSLSYATICSSAAPTACFFGPVTSYSGTTLVVNVTSTSGTGTHTDWLITVAGPTGATGPQGNPGNSASGTASAAATTLTVTHNFGTTTHAFGGCIDGTTGAFVDPSVISLGLNSDTITFGTGSGLLHSTTCYVTTGGAGGGSSTFTLANAGTTGTTVNTLTKATAGTAVIATTADTNGIIGITTSGAGTSGNATITPVGSAPCVFDGGTTANDYVVESTVTGGDCSDSGSIAPVGVQVIGRVWSTNASAGTYTINIFPPSTPPFIGGSGILCSGSGLGVTCTFNTAILPTHAVIQSGAETYAVSSNGTTTYTASLSATAVLLVYTTGQSFLLNVDTTCASSCSLNINGLGAKTITKKDGSTAPGGALVAAQAQFVWYDGTVFRLMYF